MAKGHITIFLSLIMTILLSFLFTLVEGARMNAIKLRVECVVDMAMDSCFAEYNRELLKQYDLFYIDTTYGVLSPSLQNTQMHMSNYMKENFMSQNYEDNLLYREWYGLDVANISIVETAIATDEQGMAYKRQAIDYIKDKVGLSLLENIENNIAITEKFQLHTTNIEQENKDNQTKIDQLEKPRRQREDGEWEEVAVDNPADVTNGSRGAGVLYLVTDNVSNLSTQGINLDSSISHRTPNRGTGLCPDKENPSSARDSMLFNEYMMEKFASYQKNTEKNQMKYQLEYIICGKENDLDNLKSIASRLLALREASNFIYLISDSEKVAEADALAATLAIIVLLPEIQPLIKMSILFAWSFAESVNDVKILLNGHKVPLIKTKSDWHLSLVQMLDYKSHLSSEGNTTNGLLYDDYLRLFLYFTPENTKIFRSMDMIECDIRRTEGNNKFQMDACIDYLLCEFYIISDYGYEWSLKRKYYYN